MNRGEESSNRRAVVETMDTEVRREDYKNRESDFIALLSWYNRLIIWFGLTATLFFDGSIKSNKET